MAEKIDFNYCKKIIRKHFKFVGVKANNFLHDLLLISMGVKPSLLFDYACYDGEKLVKLMDELKECSDVFACLRLIVVGCDVFIADVDKLLPLLKENLKDECFTLINVTGELDKPCILDAKTQKKILGHFADLISQVEDKNRQCSHLCDIDVKEDWNNCTMFGFVLCYPVIYWFDTKVEHNCLSLVPLVLYQAKMLGKTLDKLFFQTDHSVDDKFFISFSCPELLLHLGIERHIDRWTKRVKQTAEECGVIVDIEKSVVTLKQVAL